MNEYIIQGIGFIGVALFVVSYQIKSNRALFLCQLLGCLVFSAQFFIMGAYTGALSLVVNIIRNVLLLLAKTRKWAQSRIVMAAILLLLAVLTAFTWAGWPSLVMSFSVAVTTVGYWTQNAQKIRLSQMIGSPCALAYDVIIRSWGGVVSARAAKAASPAATTERDRSSSRLSGSTSRRPTRRPSGWQSRISRTQPRTRIQADRSGFTELIAWK